MSCIVVACVAAAITALNKKQNESPVFKRSRRFCIKTNSKTKIQLSRETVNTQIKHITERNEILKEIDNEVEKYMKEKECIR